MTRHSLARAALWSAATTVAFVACDRCRCARVSRQPEAAAHRPVDPSDIAEIVYDGGLRNGWQDWGWAPHELAPGGPAAVHFDRYGGWIVAKPSLTGDFGGVVFRVHGGAGQRADLEAHLLSTGGDALPKVQIAADDEADAGDGWTEVFLPMSRLNPSAVPFDALVLQAFREIEGPAVLVDKIALTKPASPLATNAPDTTPAQRISIRVDCRARATRISPLIYGIALDEGKPQAQWMLGATIRRWGGNLSSTYNWEIAAWNAGNDWYFENRKAPDWAEFLQQNAAHGVAAALTVPISGWVAKDATSVSFPVSVVGPQQGTDPWRAEAGNGKQQGSGAPLPPGPPDRAYRAVGPEFVKRWIAAIRGDDREGGDRSVATYILDNEPMLWSTTHRDLHPDPVTYDELLNRTIEYATAIREADPAALIAGPAEWGWTNYLYSADDMASGGPAVRRDRRAHGDVPLIAYYLKTLADHERSTGVRLLDVLDLHAYPYADKVYGDADDSATAALRIRTTRMLWDPTYVDESWVKEPVSLLPRMRDWVDKNYPGRRLSIGEWNFGGERHMSGALAIAEALGRYAQFGLFSAYYWTCPAENTPAMWAFRAYRDYDGKGSKFLDWFTTATVDGSDEQSVFASRDSSGKRMVLVLLNFARARDVTASIDVSSCGAIDATKAYVYDGAAVGLVARPSSSLASPIRQALPRYSITVLQVELGGDVPVVQ